MGYFYLVSLPKLAAIIVIVFTNIPIVPAETALLTAAIVRRRKFVLTVGILFIATLRGDQINMLMVLAFIVQLAHVLALPAVLLGHLAHLVIIGLLTITTVIAPLMQEVLTTILLAVIYAVKPMVKPAQLIVSVVLAPA